jgi:hypothetical protein
MHLFTPCVDREKPNVGVAAALMGVMPPQVTPPLFRQITDLEHRAGKPLSNHASRMLNHGNELWQTPACVSGLVGWNHAEVRLRRIQVRSALQTPVVGASD